MTREDSINLLKQVNHILVNDDDYWIENTHEPLNTAFSMAIKALEKESILDKVRAEIADLDDADYDYEGYYKAVTDALQIIDKYKAETEKEE